MHTEELERKDWGTREQFLFISHYSRSWRTEDIPFLLTHSRSHFLSATHYHTSPGGKPGTVRYNLFTWWLSINRIRYIFIQKSKSPYTDACVNHESIRFLNWKHAIDECYKSMEINPPESRLYDTIFWIDVTYWEDWKIT